MVSPMGTEPVPKLNRTAMALPGEAGAARPRLRLRGYSLAGSIRS